MFFFVFLMFFCLSQMVFPENIFKQEILWAIAQRCLAHSNKPGAGLNIRLNFLKPSGIKQPQKLMVYNFMMKN